MKRLVEIAKENDLCLDEVINKFNYQTKKLYFKKYNRELEETLNELDDQAYSIVERYFKRRSKGNIK